MSSANLDATAVDQLNGSLQQPKSGDLNSLINEDVMQQIWDISKIPLPLTDLIGSDSAKNPYTEWTKDELAAPDGGNAVEDGWDATGNDTVLGDRVGNHAQNSVKVVQVSTRAQDVDTIGRSDELGYQVMRRQQELRRDVEYISLSDQGSQADAGVGTEGKSAGLGAWLSSNIVLNGATVAGFQAGTKLVPAVTTGTIAPLTESDIRDVTQQIYTEGGNATKIMMTPPVCSLLSQYMFTSSARIGTILSDQQKSSEKATALGSVNVFVTDFGTLDFVPNRLQPTNDTVVGASNVFIIDPSMIRHGFITGYNTSPLAKTGLSDKRLMNVDWTLKVLTEKASGQIRAVSNTAPVEA